jgi:hypothetical protein
MTATLIAAAVALLTLSDPAAHVKVQVPMDSMAQCLRAAAVARADLDKAGEKTAIVTCTEGG